MCGIVASKSINTFKKLIELNQSRGSFSYSLTILFYSDDYSKLGNIELYKGFGEFNFKLLDDLNEIDTMYLIGHIQAPTNGLVEDIERIHPSKYYGHYLYHNGILKTEYINEYAKMYSGWDTELLNKMIFGCGYNCLEFVKGSFACIELKGSIISVFRNNNSIIYYDRFMNFSSAKFDDSIELSSGEVFNINLHDNKLIPTYTFKCSDNYYVEI